MEASKQVEVVAATALFVLRSSMPSLTQAEAINLLRDSFQQMAMQGSSHEEHNRVVEGTSSPAADSRSHTGSSGQRSLLPPVAAVPPIAAGHTLPLDEDAVSRMRSAAADSRSPTASSGQRSLLPPVAAVPPIPAGHTLPLDGAAVTRMRRLPKEVKAGRLIQAAKDGAVSELQALLAAGADVEARDKGWGRTALHWAAARGHTEAARCLVDAGAPLEWRDCSEMTPLCLAASNGHVDVVKLLVASSAAPNSTSYFAKSPLEIAVENGHAEVATVLLDAGASKWDRFGSEIIIPGHP